MVVLGATEFNGSAVYISSKIIVEYFSTFLQGFEAFYYFCKGESIWRRPNADTLRFTYDPMTGNEIDWKQIYNENKHKFFDFDEELDKQF
jgi:hypothetical protein